MYLFKKCDIFYVKKVIGNCRNCISFNRQCSVLPGSASLVETRITMSEKSLEEVLKQLHSERTACEEILDEMQSLKNGEFKEVFGQAFATAMLKSYTEAEAEISEELKQVVSSSVAAASAISSRLEESTSLLEKQASSLKQVQRRCTFISGICLGLIMSCFMFIGWTGYSYWLIRSTTSSIWFQKIIVENADVIDKCLDPEVLKHSSGKCTIQLPVRPVH